MSERAERESETTTWQTFFHFFRFRASSRSSANERLGAPLKNGFPGRAAARQLRGLLDRDALGKVSERETRERRGETTAEDSNALSSALSIDRFSHPSCFSKKKSKNPKPQHRLVAALEHHLSEWHRLGAPELVRQYLEEEEKATKNGETSKESRKKTRFRRASATVLEVSALPPPTPPLVSSRPEPYLLTLHIPLCSSRSSSRLTAAGVAEGDIPSGLGPHVSWGRDGEEGRG